MGQSSPTVRQSKPQRLGEGAGLFSTHKPTARAARVACRGPGNLAALKPPLGKRPQIQHGLCQWEKEEELHLCSEYILESMLYSTGADQRNMKELNYHRIYPIEMLTWLRSRFSMR